MKAEHDKQRNEHLDGTSATSSIGGSILRRLQKKTGNMTFWNIRKKNRIQMINFENESIQTLLY